MSHFIYFIILSAVQDWEKEAKKKIRIEMDDSSVDRRRTIYDLNSYASFGPSMSDISKFNTMQITTEPSRKTRYSVSVNISACANGLFYFQNFKLSNSIKRKILKNSRKYIWIRSNLSLVLNMSNISNVSNIYTKHFYFSHLYNISKETSL